VSCLRKEYWTANTSGWTIGQRLPVLPNSAYEALHSLHSTAQLLIQHDSRKGELLFIYKLPTSRIFLGRNAFSAVNTELLTRQGSYEIQYFKIYINYIIINYIKLKTELCGISPWANYTDRANAACRRKLVTAFADRGCHVVSVTDPYGPYSWFSRPEPLFCLSSSSSIVLTRMSRPRSRRTTSQKIW
jgi:hypothetical protein